MSVKGELPKLDAAIFADTGWEPKAVYEHLEYLKGIAEAAAIPVYTVSKGNIRADALRSRVRGYDKTKGERWVSMPYHTLNPDGSKGMIRRQCTSEYKIEPVQKKCRELTGKQKGEIIKGVQVELWMGISRDEMRRMRQSRVRWIEHRYPLVFDVPMSRNECLEWLERNGFPVPPRSACIGCPYKSNREWRNTQVVPDEWQDAVEFDGLIRDRDSLHETAGIIRRELFLHRDCKPLSEVDLSTPEERGQLNWLQECEGYCGN